MHSGEAKRRLGGEQGPRALEITSERASKKLFCREKYPTGGSLHMIEKRKKKTFWVQRLEGQS